MSLRFLIVGSGFSGAVLANNLANHLDCKIDIWDERNHIGGNCYTQRDKATNVMVHEYGPHIFNTDRKDIWDYVNSFVEFVPYVHRVKSKMGKSVYSMPVNLHTINQFFNSNFSPDEARSFLATLADNTIGEPQNFEEQALKFIGKDLYNAFFYGYTKKQWGCKPSELPASILKRIPVRFNYNDNYYNHAFTGIPLEGYTVLIEKLICHSCITTTLNKKFHSGIDISEFDHIFYTGPIDEFFNHQFGRLGYRTVTFEKGYADNDFQGTAQMNYSELDIPFTRIIEHKHFAPWEKHEKTIYFKEFSKETTGNDIPYYPKRLKGDKEILKLYREEAEKQKSVSFLGRLATYRYMDMHHVIAEALDFSNTFIENSKANLEQPVFLNSELY
jgi:UDP-galactopyranose mutase